MKTNLVSICLAFMLLSLSCAHGAALMDIAGKADFPEPQSLDDSAATQLKRLCSLAEFRALPAADRHVYSFDVWPVATNSLGTNVFTFAFGLGTTGVAGIRIRFQATGGGPGGSHSLTRVTNAESTRCRLAGLGNLDWGGKSQHLFTFDKSVTAFGVVLRSSGDFELRKFYWQAAKELNGYPISYTLADGTLVQLGERDLRGALLKGETNAFVGVIDRSGRGIISVSYTLHGLAGNKAQSISMSEWAFATMPKPAVANIITLRSSCDFEAPETINATPTPAMDGLASLDAFRFIVANHRYVYHFDTWPAPHPQPRRNAVDFLFDLKGKGAVDQQVTVVAAHAGDTVRPVQTMLRDDDSLPNPVLGGLGDIRTGAWAEQTFTFTQPVWAVGVVYSCAGDASLGKPAAAQAHPLSYTLSDGTVVNLGTPGGTGGVMAGNHRTFVGVIDQTDKGIASVTLRVQGTAAGAQPLYIEDLAFALAGPPPGDWKLTLNENFDGATLNTNVWTPGYTFADVINNEMQGYVPENILVSNGICTIKVELRDCVNTDRTGRKGGAQKFASGAFTSFDRFTQTYGYFEARVKMTQAPGPGTWPAFWMLPDRGRDYPEKIGDRTIRRAYLTKEYGRGIEIDIFEFMPWWKTREGRFFVHVGCIWSYGKVTEKDPAPHGYGAYALENDGWGPRELTYPNADTEFHTYGLYWSPERLIFYLDSKPVFRVRDAQHVPDVPHYFLFNVALSGNGWGKSPDKQHPTYQQIVDGMPNRMEIDYFRAYSGVLDEAVPAAPSDIPGVVRKYAPPSPSALTPAAPALLPAAPASAPAAPAGAVPPAPANSQITSPSNG
jgi:beta-glucanase (GH16 family)